MRARVVAPLVAAVLGTAGGVATALTVPADNDNGAGDGGDRTSVSDPLNLGIPLVNQECTGEALLVVGYGDSRPALSRAVANSNADMLKYLVSAGSCDTQLGPERQPPPAYIVYEGPFDTRREPCETRMSGVEGNSYVTVLTDGNTTLVKCPCEVPLTTAPLLRPGMEADQHAVRWIRALQNMLHDRDPDGFPTDAVTGEYDARTAAVVRSFQEAAPGKVTVPEVVDLTTWGILTERLCRQYVY